MANGSADSGQMRVERFMLDWGRTMLGNASLTKTANLGSFAHWPTQRFETIAQAGRPVTIGNGAPFRWFWPVFQACLPRLSGNPGFPGIERRAQFHKRYRRVLRVR